MEILERPSIADERKQGRKGEYFGRISARLRLTRNRGSRPVNIKLKGGRRPFRALAGSENGLNLHEKFKSTNVLMSFRHAEGRDIRLYLDDGGAGIGEIKSLQGRVGSEKVTKSKITIIRNITLIETNG